MSFFTNLPRLAFVGALAYSLLVATITGAAMARAADLTKVLNCTGVPAGVETTTLTIDLESFSIPAQWSDPGSHYEVVTDYDLEVFPSLGSKTVVCESHGNWGTREYPMYNAWTGNWWSYPLELRLVVNNFPTEGYSQFNIWMWEEDSGVNLRDGLDLNPYPDNGRLQFSIYPALERAFMLRSDGAEIQDSTHMMVFGISKRFIGTGGGVRLFEDVAASIDITISAADIPKVGGAIPAPGNKDPNLPSPGQPVLDNEQTCRNYALQAVEWNQIAQQLQCPGLNPPVWSNDHQMHFDWCMIGDNSNTTAFHNNQRAWAIQTCRGN